MLLHPSLLALLGDCFFVHSSLTPIPVAATASLAPSLLSACTALFCHLFHLSIPHSFSKVTLGAAVSMYVHHMRALCHRGPKSLSDPLRLQLQMAVSHLLGAGTGTRVFCKSTQCSPTLSHLLSHHHPFKCKSKSGGLQGEGGYSGPCPNIFRSSLGAQELLASMSLWSLLSLSVTSLGSL